MTLRLTAKDADELGDRLAKLIARGHRHKAYDLIAPTLAIKTKFHLLDRIGSRAGAAPYEPLCRWIDKVAAAAAMGGWVIIGSALTAQLADHRAEALAKCRRIIAMGGCWYVTDILGERVPGPALLGSFKPTVTSLGSWRTADSRWVRRAVGVAAHFWAKRSRGAAPRQAKELVRLLEPMFEEREIDAVKGIGWGLKTLGRHYPEQLTPWLAEQVARPHRALMLRKATAYLTAEQRAVATGN